MTHYFVDNSAQPDGVHEVHAVGCRRMAIDKQYLGDFLTCESAVVEARKQFWQTGSCVRCMDVLSDAETVRISQLYFEFPPGRTART